MIRRLPLIPTLLVAAAVATMIALGVWQLRRAEWKESLIARFEAASDRPEIGFPTVPLKEPLPLFRRAAGTCLSVAGWRATAGRSRAGEPGYAIIADCRTGAEGPGMAVQIGWSKDPNAGRDFSGGAVRGIIAPDRQSRMRLIADRPAAGLAPSAPPSPDTIPNNHRAYAVQWFLFAALALLIYFLALRRKRREAADG